MSVAFRRESDDEHLEPKFDVPIPAGPNLVTPRGLALIEERIAALEGTLAGLTDEAAIATAKRDLRYWHARQANAEVQPEASGSTVRFGSRVTFTLAGKTRTVAIVGHDEADPAAGLLSFNAPLIRALMGAEVGDLLDYNGVDEAIEVIAVE